MNKCVLTYMCLHIRHVTVMCVYARGVSGIFFPDTDDETSGGPQTPPPTPHSPWKDMISRFWRQKSKYRRQNSNIWCQNVALNSNITDKIQIKQIFVQLKTSRFVREKLPTQLI